MSDALLTSSSLSPHDTPLSFANFQLDLVNQQLLRDGQPVRMMPKTFDVLRYLVEHPQRLVSKRELLDALWPGVIVGDGVLKAQVNELRRLLGDTSKSRSFIETLHRRGYRFSLPVQRCIAPPGTLACTSGELPATPLRHCVVGRDEQLQSLTALLQLVEHGHPQLVFVTGEPGLGKTTVVNAFLAMCCSPSHHWSARGQCVEQYGSSSAYLPILEILRQLCVDGNSDLVTETLRRQAPDWWAHMPMAATLPDQAAQRCATPTPERLVRQLVEALDALSALRPMILVIEDLQWVDPSTLHLISYLAQRFEKGRLLLVATYRSGDVRLTEHPVWELHQHLRCRELCQELALSTLEPNDVEWYLASQFADHPGLSRMAAKVFAITSGHPLFMVRIVHDLVLRGAIQRQLDSQLLLSENETSFVPHVPDSVVSMIAWEVERAASGEREILEAASVMGIEFTTDALACVLARSPVAMENVCDRWARQRRFLESAIAEEVEALGPTLRCRFSHSLYPRVIYDQLVPSRRAHLHSRFGLYMEKRHAARLEPVAASLAMQFAHAGDARRSLRYCCLAGEYSLKHGAYSEATLHFNKALELLHSLPDSLERQKEEVLVLLALRVPLVATLGYASPEVEQLHDRALRKGSEILDTESSFAVYAGVSLFQLVRGRIREAMDVAGHCQILAQRNASLLVDSEMAAALSSYYCGDMATAEMHFDMAIAQQHVAPIGRTSAYHRNGPLLAQCYSALLLWYRGQTRSAQAKAQDVLHLARVTEDPFTLAVAIHHHSLLHVYMRQPEELTLLSRELGALSSDHGFSFYSALATVQQGVAAFRRGAFEVGIAMLREGMAQIKGAGAELGWSQWCAELAEAYAVTGDIDAGFRILREGLEFVHERGEHFWEPELYRVHGELCAGQSHLSRRRGLTICGLSNRPEDSFQRALQLASQMNAKPLELRAATSAARHRGEAQRSSSLRSLRSILSSFSEGEGSPDYEHARACLSGPM